MGAMIAVLKRSLQVAVAALLLTALWCVSLWALGRLPGVSAGAVPAILLPLLGANLLVGGVLVYLAVRSRWGGLQLAIALFVTYFGLHVFVPLGELFLLLPDGVSQSVGPLLVANGFLIGLAASAALVVVTGRLRAPGDVGESARLHMPPGMWLRRLAACAAARVLTKGVALGSLHVAAGAYSAAARPVVTGAWALIQAGQALLLVVFVLPLVKMLRGGRVEACLAAAAVLGVLGGIAPAIASRPFLPEAVPRLHALEVTASNAVYGGLVGLLFSYGMAGRRELP
jgi:hypothetical protein